MQEKLGVAGVAQLARNGNLGSQWTWQRAPNHPKHPELKAWEPQPATKANQPVSEAHSFPPSFHQTLKTPFSACLEEGGRMSTKDSYARQYEHDQTVREPMARHSFNPFRN